MEKYGNLNIEDRQECKRLDRIKCYTNCKWRQNVDVSFFLYHKWIQIETECKELTLTEVDNHVMNSF